MLSPSSPTPRKICEIASTQALLIHRATVLAIGAAFVPGRNTERCHGRRFEEPRLLYLPCLDGTRSVPETATTHV